MVLVLGVIYGVVLLNMWMICRDTISEQVTTLIMQLKVTQSVAAATILIWLIDIP